MSCVNNTSNYPRSSLLPYFLLFSSPLPFFLLFPNLAPCLPPLFFLVFLVFLPLPLIHLPSSPPLSSSLWSEPHHHHHHQDIFMTCGTHGALEISFRVLCEPGRSLLLPSPCYTMYKCLSKALQVTPKHYRLLVRKWW